MPNRMPVLLVPPITYRTGQYSFLRAMTSFILTFFVIRHTCRNLTSDLPILPAEEQQRITFPHRRVFDFSNKDRMVAGFLRAVQAALEICQSSIQHRRAMASALKASPRPLRVLMGLRGSGVIL